MRTTGIGDGSHLKAEFSRERGGIPLVSVSGEVDLATVGELEAVSEEAVSVARETASCLIFDLRGVGFMEVTGLNALIRARNAVPGGFVAVVCSGWVGRLLELAGLSESFHLCASLDEALGICPDSDMAS